MIMIMRAAWRPHLSHGLLGSGLVGLLFYQRLCLLPEAVLQEGPQQGAALGERPAWALRCCPGCCAHGSSQHVLHLHPERVVGEASKRCTMCVLVLHLNLLTSAGQAC